MNIALVILWILVIYVIAKYNSIISLKNTRENAFSDIDVQLKQRFDLIPNLVETVRGYANHEKEALIWVVEARNKYTTATSTSDKIEADNMLQSSLKSIFALSESYPDLKANQNFLQLQAELSDIENKIAASRRFFNSSTREFNTSIEMFPGNIIANIFGFKKEEFFEIVEQQERNVPKVQF